MISERSIEKELDSCKDGAPDSCVGKAVSDSGRGKCIDSGAGKVSDSGRGGASDPVPAKHRIDLRWVELLNLVTPCRLCMKNSNQLESN